MPEQKTAQLVGLVSLIAIMTSLPTLAQTSTDDTDVVDEIIVTTQKRSQSLRDVPVTVTSYTGRLLEDLNIDEFDEVSEITPGLIIQEQSPNNPAFVIRGITSDSGSAQIAPRVSIYLNGIDVSRSRGSHFELFDIERIEVAKGPQATLFGTASAIGAVSVITRKAQEEFDAELSVGYGNFDAYQARGFITGGNQTLQGRLAFSYRKRDGFIENIAGDAGSQSEGGTVQPDLNGIERFGIRGSVRFVPNDNFTADLVINYEENDDTGTSFKSGNFAPTGGATDPFSFAELGGAGPRSEEVLGSATLGIERDLFDGNLTMQWDLNENWSITSVSGYREFDSLEVFDADGTAAIFAEFAEDSSGDQFSQELRANYGSDTLNAFFGVNYFTESGRQRVPFLTEEGTFLQCAAGVIPDLPCVAPDGTVGSVTAAQGLPPIFYDAEFGNTGSFDIYSAFADATIGITERLEFTAGIRYVYEERESGSFARLPNSVLTGAPLLAFGNVDTGGNVVTASEDYSAFLPRFNVRFEASDDVNFYATVAKGRRSDVIDVGSIAGPNGTPVADPTFIPEEVIWNYEGGMKARLLDGRLDVAASAFYQDYENFQVTILDPNGVTRPSNAGSASNFGVEGEFRSQLNQYFQVFGNVAYIDAQIDDEAENGIFAGNRFRLQPKWSTALGGLMTVPITDDINFFANATWTYRSSAFFEIENAQIAGLDIAEDAVNLVNVRAGFAAADDSWEINVFANNLFDREYIIDAGNTGGAFGSPTFVAGPPRFYGVQLTGRF
ncbi:TonB-dependent receptor [Kordiimonas aquimaris]|uniref:TonB-dependent receptor n=1 Tax=Kordiimonas aquimaris TaxID=707591 RepID=UPI0021D3C4AA|nr:TonB-dependent receptor [Kordiimonas aquimaris]